MRVPSSDRPELSPDPILYPDLVEAGGLAKALAQEAKKAEAELAFLEASGRERQISASLRTRDGYVGVNIGAEERWFIVSIWSRGVHVTTGSTGSLSAVVTATNVWAAGATFTELDAACPFLKVSDLALAHETGPEAAVTHKWQQLRASWSADERFHLTAEIIDVAHAEPALRQLFPYTSHATLCFSACTGFPYSEGIPRIEPSEAGYMIRTQLGGAVLGVADTAHEAVAIVLAHLPAGLGPAVEGASGDR